ncbi:MAG TPA: CYTH domain-containing protein [Vicinamibacterales bacterium]|jgi:adenylate cyclase|nr:CYTH domain-containing protein [Vicinamibacterales bacterium]
MATEIERKFLVTGPGWRAVGARGVPFRQGYLSTTADRVVRVRIEGDCAVLTIKGRTTGITRVEFEYPIPLADATTMIGTLCERPIVEKTRYRVLVNGVTWEIDEFHGDNDGLVVAEVELASADQPVTTPPWIGREVSNDPRYFNANLVSHPYREWRDR